MVRGGRNFRRRKLVRTTLGAIVSGLCVVALISTPTSQRHRQVVTDNVATLSNSATTLGFADSRIYFYDDAKVADTVQRWVADNIRTVRIGIPWSGVESVKGRMDRSRSDRVVNAAAAANISIIASILSSAVVGNRRPRQCRRTAGRRRPRRRMDCSPQKSPNGTAEKLPHMRSGTSRTVSPVIHRNRIRPVMWI